MEPQVGGNSFQDRPGTRMRIVLRPDGETQPGRAWNAFAWTFKIFYALAAGAFCAAIASYAPVAGPAIAAFVPSRCTLLIQTPSGAALHRALLDNPAFTELLNDPDTAALVESLAKTKPQPTVNDANEPIDAAPLSLRAQFDAAYAKLPWPVSWLIPPNESGFYPFVGNEFAIALERSGDATLATGKKKSSTTALIFLRVSESRGHLARLAAVFFHASKNVELFDLGGGLIAIGLNGAYPEFEKHAPPMVVSANSTEPASPPLLRISFSPKSLAVPMPKDQPLDLNNETIERLFEEDVPKSVLLALEKPPGIGDMLNWKTPPALARIDLFAAPGGRVVARGRIEGDVPQPSIITADATTENKKPRPDSFADFSATGPMAEFALPIDLRACFLRYVEGSMRLSKDAKGLTRGQRLWVSRFRVLAEDRVDLDASFWPMIGHAAAIEIHESKKDEDATPLGTIKMWLPCDAKNPETLFAAADLARARWDYLFDNADKITVKAPYVKRFRSENELTDTQGDRFVLATGKINAPAWSVGPKGLRITTDAGIFAVRDGPKEADFITPPKALDSYHMRLDGPRLASTVESLATVYYDDVEDDIGSQKFLALHPDRELNIRLARKWASLMGKLALEIVPDSTGAELKLNWKPGSMSASANLPTAKESNGTPPKTDRKEPKKDPKKPDDDDAPPPPPAN